MQLRHRRPGKSVRRLLHLNQEIPSSFQMKSRIKSILLNQLARWSRRLCQKANNGWVEGTCYINDPGEEDSANGDIDNNAGH